MFPQFHSYLFEQTTLTAGKTLCLASLPLNLDFQLVRFIRELVGILFKRLELTFPLISKG